ncbi:MAG: GMC family oxidoreductase [Deltaproteobacteria bacterium]|nr:GMC family oxidoreductase [Deltaproteobacteria bacterium]
MNLVDGAQLTGTEHQRYDFVVVGSGPAGATVARALARAGASVAVVEEGPAVTPEQCPEDGFSAMAELYRDLGASLTIGHPPIAYVQGRVVGGGSVINGAISWRLPRDVFGEWTAADPALAEALPWPEIEAQHDEIETDLDVVPTHPAVAGAKNSLMAAGAEALGLEHRPIARYASACRGLGRCLQGCPEGHKASMDRTYLAEACRHGAQIYCSTRVEAVNVDRGRAAGIAAVAEAGATLQLGARRAVVLAASAVQTPVLLWRSRIRQGPVGDFFQCHPGVSVAGRFAEPVRMWTGATQGHEVIGLRSEGLKIEVLGYDRALVAFRLKGVGRTLRRGVGELAHWCQWGAAIRARGTGRVRPSVWGGSGGRASVRYWLAREDVVRARRGVRVLGEMMLAAGAERVCPGVHGWHAEVCDRATMAGVEQDGPLDPTAYSMAATHLFGTCRMGSDPRTSVVRPDFRHHAVRGLYVADSSVFPSNIGVNPQTSIMAMAGLCARRLLDESPPG